MVTNKQEYFITQKPKSTFLQQYIAYYYFHTCKNHNLKQQYIYYPHYKNALSIYKNSTIKCQDNNAWISPSLSKRYSYAYESIPQTFQRVFQQAPFDKIAIAFQALGINYFIKEPLSKIISQFPKQSFSYFNPSFTSSLDLIYSTENINQKVALLDEYFLSQYTEFGEQRLVQAVALLLDTTAKYSVSEIAKLLTIDRKTLFRIFKKHLACSVKDYMHVVRFRQALDYYQLATQKPLLTNLAYQNNFYDQAELINHFKRITGCNPSKIFQSIEPLGTEDIFWAISPSIKDNF